MYKNIINIPFILNFRLHHVGDRSQHGSRMFNTPCFSTGTGESNRTVIKETTERRVSEEGSGVPVLSQAVKEPPYRK